MVLSSFTHEPIYVVCRIIKCSAPPDAYLFSSLEFQFMLFNLLLDIHLVTTVIGSFIPCLGLSLKTQELTAIFTAVRLYCSFLMEGDIHTVLDFATLVFTAWVIYMIRFKLKSTYIAELDNMPLYYLVITFSLLNSLCITYTVDKCQCFH